MRIAVQKITPREGAKNENQSEVGENFRPFLLREL